MGEVASLAAARARRELRDARSTEAVRSKKHVAEHFDVSVRTVERWIKAGLPVATATWAGHPRLRISEVEDWLASR